MNTGSSSFIINWAQCVVILGQGTQHGTLVYCQNLFVLSMWLTVQRTQHVNVKPEVIYIMIQKHYNWLGMGRDSSVGIATGYGLDGPGIESRRRWDFSAPIQTGPGGRPASYSVGTGCFPEVKRPGRGADHPPASSAEVKERVELYFYSPLGLRGLF
jgi:hypothetical protein